MVRGSLLCLMTIKVLAQFMNRDVNVRPLDLDYSIPYSENKFVVSYVLTDTHWIPDIFTNVSNVFRPLCLEFFLVIKPFKRVVSATHHVAPHAINKVRPVTTRPDWLGRVSRFSLRVRLVLYLQIALLFVLKVLELRRQEGWSWLPQTWDLQRN